MPSVPASFPLRFLLGGALLVVLLVWLGWEVSHTEPLPAVRAGP